MKAEGSQLAVATSNFPNLFAFPKYLLKSRSAAAASHGEGFKSRELIMKKYHAIADRHWGGARTWVLISLIVLLAVLVPVGLYLVSTLSFGNGTTVPNLAVPDTGVTASAARAAPAGARRARRESSQAGGEQPQ